MAIGENNPNGSGSGTVSDGDKGGVVVSGSGTQWTVKTGTEIVSGSVISINGGDNTKFDLAAGAATILDNSTPASPTFHDISWTAQSALTVSNLLTDPRTNIALSVNNTPRANVTFTNSFTATVDGASQTVYIAEKSASDWSTAERRIYVPIGRLVHSDNTVLFNAVNLQQFGSSVINSLVDYLSIEPPKNVEGNEFSGKSGVLQVAKTAGKGFRFGSNYDTDSNDPNVQDIPAADPTTHFYRYQNGSGGFSQSASTNLIDPANYDDGTGTLATVTNNRWTLQPVWVFAGSGTMFIQYGQEEFASKIAAIEAIPSVNPVLDPNLTADAVFRGWFVVVENATDLSDSAEFEWRPPLSEIGGGQGTTAVVDIQAAYDASVNPEFTTDATRGAMTGREGTGDNTQDVYEAQNNAGSKTWAVRGDGAMGVGGAANTAFGIFMSNSFDNGIYVNNNVATSGAVSGVNSNIGAFGTATEAIGVRGQSNGGGVSVVAVGVEGNAFTSGAVYGGNTSIGVKSMLIQNSVNAGDVTGFYGYIPSNHANNSYGIMVDVANSGAGNAYIGKLQDGTEGAGKFLKSIDANGTAQWAAITSSDVSGGVDGSGTTNYVARWTPDGDTLGNSTIRDDGSTVGVNTAPNAAAQLLLSTTLAEGISADNGKTDGNAVGVRGFATGANTGGNFGMQAKASGGAGNVGLIAGTAGAGQSYVTGTDIGVYAIAANTSGNNTAVYAVALQASGAENIGVYANVANGSTNYAAQLVDGTESVGRFLKNVAANGKANWAAITASDVSGAVDGSGTADYIARWTPDGDSLGNSTFRDDGTNLAIGTAPSSIYVINIQRTNNTAQVGIANNTVNTSVNTVVGIQGTAGGGNASAGETIGTQGTANASGSGTVAIGIKGSAIGGGSTPAYTSIGVWGNVDDNSANAGDATGLVGTAKNSHANDNYGIVVDVANAGAGSAYIGKLQDGTQGAGKVLTSDANGVATWQTATSTDSAAIHDNVANEITAITEKTSIDNQDELIIEDSEASYVKKSVTRKTLIDPTIQSTASTATLTPNANEDDQVVVTALAANMTIAAPSGTPVQGQKLIIRIEDNGTSRTLTWNAIYEVVGVTLPTATTASKKIYVGCIYNSTDTKWDVVAVKEEA